MVSQSLYSCAYLKCPAVECRGRVDVAEWVSLVDDDVFEKYYQSAESLLTYRCPDCDAVGSLLNEQPGFLLPEHPWLLEDADRERNTRGENKSEVVKLSTVAPHIRRNMLRDQHRTRSALVEGAVGADASGPVLCAASASGEGADAVRFDQDSKSSAPIVQGTHQTTNADDAFKLFDDWVAGKYNKRPSANASSRKASDKNAVVDADAVVSGIAAAMRRSLCSSAKNASTRQVLLLSDKLGLEVDDDVDSGEEQEDASAGPAPAPPETNKSKEQGNKHSDDEQNSSASEQSEPPGSAQRLAPPDGGTKNQPHPFVKRFFERIQKIRDLERKCTLLLAWYRRFPYFKTPCCFAAMCFKCKTSEWHVGQSCEQRMREGLGAPKGGVQWCPRCGVPTVKSEGCNHIICVCGASWEFRKSHGC
eukprot:g10428.t1